ncbi:MAG: TetR/AcrR family transcriptional regulator [Arenimonas sp.]|nr:TetR/AcrR family transcriptional regulator [Arenimonas sp.]
MELAQTASSDKIRLSASDWQQAALDALSEGGLQNIAIEMIAKRLGVTKGSFYWHFDSRDALIQAALELWESQEQEQVFGKLDALQDAQARLTALVSLVASELKAHKIYSELLKAIDHPLVKPVLERVSKRRIDYLTASFRMAGLPRKQALNRALLTYASYVGFLQLNLQLGYPKLSHGEFEQYVGHLTETLIPASG